MGPKQGKPQDSEAEDEEIRQYTTAGQTLEELNEIYPQRPRNHSSTLLFSELYSTLFNPLNENKKQPGAQGPRAKRGGSSKSSPQEQRRHIIESFIARWRSEVGNDFYPALRLILPTSDRDRGIYSLKESNIGKLLVKLIKIDKNSEDAYSILNWKLPGQSAATRRAGDFAGRCFDVLSKRPMRIEPGDMHIADVNEQLDKLAAASKESEQLPIFETFYRRMNAEELMWLIRIILKQMKVGATERTFLDVWHHDAEALFSVSSSLRKVCWELHDPKTRLTDESQDVAIMQCFQPQLAQFQISSSFQKMVDKLNKTNPIEGDEEFWVEEKLDGERMQIHMIEDDDVPGGKRFSFWSRKAKDYNYLYGSGFYDEKGSITRYLKNAFAEGVRNIILDGEMITWDPELDKMVPFGTLKTAAIAIQNNPHDENSQRPFFRAFDVLYLNDQPLTQYTLRDRHAALEKAVLGEPRRLEVHPYTKATSADAIEPLLRKVVAESSEGLVLKNPRSKYSLNSRNDDWVKVKPEYMDEFGESVDCVVIGGYYGSGKRGGGLSSFMCGLRVSDNDIQAGADPEKCFSFTKVGGGFRAEDYAQIRHLAEGKWHEWDMRKPPNQYIELASNSQKIERPDVWIRPSESFVVSVKAASVGPSDAFATRQTLRFPRFKALRSDRSWDSALDVQGFQDLKRQADEESKEKAMTMERRRRPTKRQKKDIVIAGQDSSTPFDEGATTTTTTRYAGGGTKVFEGLEFCILTDCITPVKKTKSQLETLIKENGGKISQRADAGSCMILVAEKKVVKVASLIKAGDVNIVRPRWILDCLAQVGGGQGEGFLVPYESGRHLFHATEEVAERAAETTDEFGDSYAREIDVKELKELLRDMPRKREGGEEEVFNRNEFLDQLAERGRDIGELRSHVFRNKVVYTAHGDDIAEDNVLLLKLKNWVRFGGGRIANHVEDTSISHTVIMGSDDAQQREVAAQIRVIISSRIQVPRVVTQGWIEDCWKNRTLLDEERYVPM